jgi:hypothetical protein
MVQDVARREKMNLKFVTYHQEHCFRNAVYFTAIRGGRPQNRIREEFKTFEQACAFGAIFGDKRTMIYAVTAEERAEHIVNA